MPFAKGHKIMGGRPKGTLTKPRLSDYLTEKDVQKLVKKAFEMAESGNETMLKFVLEHQFGKAVQPVAGDNDGGPIQVKIIQYGGDHVAI